MGERSIKFGSSDAGSIASQKDLTEQLLNRFQIVFEWRLNASKETVSSVLSARQLSAKLVSVDYHLTDINNNRIYIHIEGILGRI